MDIQKLMFMKHWLNYRSFTLSLENQILITNSLLLLQNENHFKKTFLWGIVQGIEADYFIAFGYIKDAITDRMYFYSEDGQNWKLLPVPTKEHLVLTELCKKPFQGDPGLLLEVVDDAPLGDLFPEEECPPEETDTDIDKLNTIEEMSQNTTGGETGDHRTENKEGKILDKFDIQKSENEPEASPLDEEPVVGDEPITSGELQEENRLAAVVHIITEEAAVVPRGGIFRQTDGINVHSKSFNGLRIEDADTLCSFQHYRQPQEDCNTNLLCRCDYNYAMDYLDSIDIDIPIDTWSAHLVEGDRTITLRNLHWPGYMFFHYVGTPDHGFIYVGNGIRNLDIPFMTQVVHPLKEPSPEEPKEKPAEEEPMDQVSGGITSQRSSRGSLRTKSKVGGGTRIGGGTTLGGRTEVLDSNNEAINTILEEDEDLDDSH